MMASARRGLLAGGVAAGAMVTAVTVTETSYDLSIQLVGLAGGSVTLSWWTLALAIGIRDAVVGGWQRWRARRRRRRDLAASRAYDPTPAFGTADDQATRVMVALDDRMSRRKRSTLLQQADEATAQGDFLGARTHLTRVLAARPSAAAHLARGRIHLTLGDYDDAMADFMRAEDLEPTNPEPIVAIGDLFYHHKDHARAIYHYTVALDLDPRIATARFHRGLCHFQLHQDEEALRDFRRAQSEDPDLPAVGRYVELAARRAGR